MTDRLETYPYRGRDRQVVGRLRYPAPPDPGQLVGPNGWGEMCVILGTGGDGWTRVGRATQPVVDAARGVTT